MFEVGDIVFFKGYPLPKWITPLEIELIYMNIETTKYYKIKQFNLNKDWIRLEEESTFGYWYPIEIFSKESRNYMKEKYNLI